MKILRRPFWWIRLIVRQRIRLKALRQEHARLKTEIQELQGTITRLHEEQSGILSKHQQLQDQVKNLAQIGNEAGSQTAALKHRVFELSLDNERLEMMLTGTRAQRDTLEALAQRFRAEIQRLKDELEALQARQK